MPLTDQFHYLWRSQIFYEILTILESPIMILANSLIKDCHGTKDARVISDEHNDLQLVGFKSSKRFTRLTLRRKLATSDKNDIDIKVIFLCTVTSGKNFFLFTIHNMTKRKNLFINKQHDK